LWLPTGHECNEQVSPPIHTSSILHVQACWVLVHSSQPMSCTWYFEILILHLGLWHNMWLIHECVNTWDKWNEWHPHFGRPIQSAHVWSVFLNKLMSPTWFSFLNMCLFALLCKLFCRKATGKMGQVLTNYFTWTSYHSIKHLVPKAASQVSTT
jgi:hypothetical protein